MAGWPRGADHGAEATCLVATPLDLAALAYFVLAIGIYRMVVGRARAEARGA